MGPSTAGRGSGGGGGRGSSGAEKGAQRGPGGAEKGAQRVGFRGTEANARTRLCERSCPTAAPALLHTAAARDPRPPVCGSGALACRVGGWPLLPPRRRPPLALPEHRLFSLFVCLPAGGKLGTAASATAAISRMARKSFERSPHGEILAAAAAAVGGAGGDQRAVVAAAGGAR